jgi:hypothetical protein
MTNYPYTRDLPVSGNDPSVDQPSMTINTNSVDSLIDEDHYSFGENNGGFHRQVRMPNLATIPLGTIAASSTLYSKVATGQGSQVFFTNANTGNEYQLTRADNTNYASFGLFPAFQYRALGPITGNAGWTFLPGGIRYQYGTVNMTAFPAGSYNLAFPIVFTTVYTVIAILQSSVATPELGELKSFTVGSFTFEYNVTAPSGSRSIQWFAIGI